MLCNIFILSFCNTVVSNTCSVELGETCGSKRAWYEWLTVSYSSSTVAESNNSRYYNCCNLPSKWTLNSGLSQPKPWPVLYVEDILQTSQPLHVIVSIHTVLEGSNITVCTNAGSNASHAVRCVRWLACNTWFEVNNIDSTNVEYFSMLDVCTYNYYC